MLVKELDAKGWKGSDVLMIAISQARQNGKNRTAGVTRALDEGGSRIVQFLQSEDYTRAEAHGQALDLLTANPDAHGFFTEHDEATLGTWAAIEDSDNTEYVILVGFDGSPESVELIRGISEGDKPPNERSQEGEVAQDRDDQARAEPRRSEGQDNGVLAG